MIERIPWLFWNCFDPLVHQHKHDKTTMFFVRFLFLGKWRGNWRGGFRIEKWGLCLLWTGNFIGSVDSISLDYKRDVKKKKSHVVEFLLNRVSHSMPSIDMDECRMYTCKVCVWLVAYNSKSRMMDGHNAWRILWKFICIVWWCGFGKARANQHLHSYPAFSLSEDS